MATEFEQGKRLLFSMLTGQHQYTRTVEEKWKDPLYVDLPIGNGASGGPVEFVGSVGITASIGAWVIQVAYKLGDSPTENPLLKLRKILLDSPESGEQHMVFFSAVFNDETEIMCNGCTDFSGEGGRGNKEASAILSVLSVMYGVTIQQDHYIMPMYEAVEQIINKVEEDMASIV